ncbi:hypothetical protein OEZ85_004156 [Tetradesmus obliquus]|uniref:Methylthioribose-1-phosphate isomerase n=1 Tax=Tetradesmus obliquus TaxID=3088 RepID=A0ABY8UGU8_TETOB|nr:hypothetical protein OEZ85_004156 [Tetradesmus obliquus]
MPENKLQAIKYADGQLQLLDQRLLPYETVYLDVPDPKAAWQQIKDMVVRGAPAIGVTGALALAVHLISGGRGKQYASVQACLDDVASTMDCLVTSRPTAVNLADSAVKLKAVAAEAAAQQGATAETVTAAVVAAAEATLEQDIAANKAIGAAGAAALLSAVAARGKANARPGGKVTVLTHCNTGSLATAGYGTALGVVRALHEQGRLERCYACETRPYNQGARLTAFELVHDGLPATLLVDSAAAALMAQGKVDAVVVGADRVVANGDTANKIGTFSHAVAAAAHGIPFFVAAPTTTLDAGLATGEEIEIEQRPAEEITHFKGQRVVVEGIDVWNPCFDVTPGRLVEGIITEEGLVPRDSGSGSHKVAAFMAARQQAQAANGTAVPRPTSSVSALDAAGVVAFLAGRPQLAKHVGPAGSEGSWDVKEVGDGNINFVYIVTGPSGGVCVKQALPYVRCVGEGWPLSCDRARIEAEALALEHKLCPQHTPQVYLYEPASSVIVMQLLGPPNVILRHAIVQGGTCPHVGRHTGEFMAATLFSTSLLAMDSRSFRQMQVRFTNPDLCALTEQVIFADPYAQAAINRWTAPQLDEAAAGLRADTEAKAAISVLKRKFCCSADALIHGDLHTGSIMVTADSSVMIDPEFAFVGPIAFDPAKIIAELLIPYFAADGHEAAQGAGSRAGQRVWLLQCIIDVWETFSSRFLELWSAKVAADGGAAAGDLSPGALLGAAADNGPAALASCQQAFVAGLWADVLGFAGAFIIRRLVGIAHTADMDSIADADVRAACELRALRFGRHLLVQGAATYKGVRELTAAAAAARQVDGLPADTAAEAPAAAALGVQ